MRKTVAITAFVGGLTILVAGCDFESRGSVNPIDPSAIPESVTITSVLLGTWSSSAAVASAGTSTSFPPASSCTELEWAITEQNGATYSGTFRATCAGGIVLDGTATGTLTGNVLNISATAPRRSLGRRHAASRCPEPPPSSMTPSTSVTRARAASVDRGHRGAGEELGRE